MTSAPEDVAQFLLAAERGLEAWSAMTGKSVPMLPNMETPVKAPVTKKIASVKKEVPAPIIPTSQGIPTAESYRLVTVDHSVCIARSLKPAGEDKRWKPSVYAETQCGGKVNDGSDLCSACVKKMEKFAEAKTAKSGWNGRLTESPPEYTHMLGTKWAAKCKWVGDVMSTESSVTGNESSVIGAESSVTDSDNDDTRSVSSEQPTQIINTTTSEPESKPEVVEPVVTMKSTAAATKKKADPEAKRAAEEAKRLEAEAKATAKRVAEEAKAEAKRVAEEAKAEAAAKKKSEAAKPKAKAKAKTTPEVKATVSATPATVVGELLTVGTDFYWVNNGNVYEYDLITEKQGDFVGRIRADGTIDSDADEVADAESDSD